MRRAEEATKRALVEALVEIAQRRPIEFGEAAVDVTARRLEAVADLGIFGDLAPGRRRNLHEGDAPARLREHLDEPLESGEAVRQALGIIEPVDADHQLAVAQAVLQPVAVPAAD